MGFFSSKTESFSWISISSVDQLIKLFESEEKYIVFKHSTRCNISSMVKSRFERDFDKTKCVNCYIVDLLNHRDVSNKISDLTNIIHQSPQVFLIENKNVLYSESHGNINTAEINNLLS